MNLAESRLGKAYRTAYALISGKHPNERLWHFQWLTSWVHSRMLRVTLGNLSGRILDVGCGAKPYKSFFGHITEYTGVDVIAGPAVDIVIEPGKAWPVSDLYYDVVLCTQVLEHVKDIENMLNELFRKVAVGGTLVITVPFLYNLHGAPNDYRRCTTFGLSNLAPAEFEVIQLSPLGGIGSTLGILFLNWIDMSLSRNAMTRAIKGLVFPLWLVLSAIVNLLAALVDNLDGTKAFYSNTLLVARRTS